MPESISNKKGGTLTTSNLFTTLLFSIFIFISVIANPSGRCSIASADDHLDHQYHRNDEDDLEEAFSLSHHRQDNEGNEFTGISAAWMMAAANITILLSFLTKGITRFFSSPSEFHAMILQFNRSQKKYLMPFHCVLNIIGLLLALIHFFLSKCGSSVLPEWGLMIMTIMTVIGVSMKLNLPPKSIKKIIYQIHTNYFIVALFFVCLLIGHQMID